MIFFKYGGKSSVEQYSASFRSGIAKRKKIDSQILILNKRHLKRQPMVPFEYFRFSRSTPLSFASGAL